MTTLTGFRALAYGRARRRPWGRFIAVLLLVFGAAWIALQFLGLVASDIAARLVR